MNLELYWKKGEDVFKLGILRKEDDEFVFSINEDELKSAIKNGCMGIGNFDLLKNEYRSNELFSFFKNRIPSEDNINIKEILAKYGLENYDEMQLLRHTRGELATDNYYLEENF